MMRRGVFAALVGVVLLAAFGGALGAAMRPGAGTTGAASGVRFMAVDVFVDSAAAPLAAWQVEVKLGAGAKLAGVEGGDATGAFAAPPTYDPAALMNDRIIIAAFSLEDAAQLPTGRVRVARLHVQLAAGSGGEAEATARFEAVVQAAASTTDNRITAAATLAPADMEERSGGDQ